MNATMNRNGQQRKSLANQIDRLDALLDGLADGLNEAVASVVKEAVGVAVKEAVRAVLSEVLQNTELLALLQKPLPATTPVDAPAQPRFRWLRASCQAVGQTLGACRATIASAMQSAVRTVCTWINQLVQRSRQACAATQQRMATLLTGCCQLVRLARSFPGPLASGLVAGIATGVAVYHAGPWISVITAGLGSFVLSAMLHLGLRLRSLLPVLTGWGHQSISSASQRPLRRG